MAEDLKAIARRTLEEILPNGDDAGLRAVMHPGVVNHEPPAGAPPGLDGMIQAMHWVKGGFSERRFEIHQVIGEGDTVVVHCTFHGRHTGAFMGRDPTNKAIALRQVHIVRFQDGKIVEHWAVRDDLGMGRQLGLFLVLQILQIWVAEPIPEAHRHNREARMAVARASAMSKGRSPGRTIPGSAASSPSTMRATASTSRS